MDARIRLRNLVCVFVSMLVLAFSFAAPLADSAEPGADEIREAWGHSQIREAIPFVMPVSPRILERRPPDPFQCGALEDFVDAGIPRQNPKEFTEAEMMLAFGWENPRAVEFWQLPSCRERTEWLKNNKENRDWLYPQFNPVRETVNLWWWVLNNQLEDVETTCKLFNLSLWGTAITDPEKEFIDELLNKFTSPVTGKLIEFKCREFSPGNMYIDLVPDNLIERYRVEVFDQFWEPHVYPEPEEVVYMYYRVYGTKGVIRSGMFWGTHNPTGALKGRT